MRIIDSLEGTNKTFVLLVALFIFIAFAFVLITNLIVYNKVKDAILPIQNLTEVDGKNQYDAIVVLGARVYSDGTPSDMLYDRLNTAYYLYTQDVSDLIIVSGSGKANPSETVIMKEWLVKRGVPKQRILEDPKGYSTSETCNNLQDNFQINNVIFVTQKYHLYRTLYYACSIGITAVGAPSPGDNYAGQWYRDFREIFARTKDFLKIKTQSFEN